MSLLVVGSLHLDVVLRAPHLPALDETVMGSAVDYVFGGKGGNQAVAAARMGARVQFAGRVGQDQFGAVLRQGLVDAGIDCTLLQEDPGHSGMSAAIVDAEGQYGAVVVSGANLELKPDQIEIPPGTRLVLLQNEIPEAVNLAVAKRAQDLGAHVWLNAAPARALPPALLGCLDLVIVNRVEAQAYGPALDGIDCLQTLGADGVRYGGAVQPGFTVQQVSAHGAGDMFVGALAARFLSGTEIPGALPFAQAAAALHVAAEPGRRDGLSPEAVEAFLRSQG